MRKYLQVLFYVLAIIAGVSILMWMGAVWASVAEHLWIATVIAVIIASFLYIGYKGSSNNT